jgi:hypothetical protein
MKTKNPKITLIFDLDETVINSKHRIPPNLPDGRFDLEGYFAKNTDENIAKDTLLPLAGLMRQAIENGYLVAILTSRTMKNADYEFLQNHGISPKFIFSRNIAKKKHAAMVHDGDYKTKWLSLMPKKLTRNHCIMFDDNKLVKKAMREIGVVCICPIKLNRKLAH